MDNDELVRRVRAGVVTLIDVRPREEYLAAHIPGAVSVSPSASPPPAGAVHLGFRENLGQFALLVVVNAFVGAMVGLERRTTG